jgi:hypothetical protein
MRSLSRRDFLKLSALALGGLAFTRFHPEITPFDDGDLVRVATSSVSVYKEPSDKSLITGTFPRDEILHVYETVRALTPIYNPIWYRVWGGYMHRARLQPVRILYNEPLNEIRPQGQLAEVTVPYSQSYRFAGQGKWEPQYRLYYKTAHWIVGLDEGPDGNPWYRLLDELLEIKYHVPVAHLRPIPDEELAPISPAVPFEKKRIEVSLGEQTLTCYEEERIVLQTNVSSGLAGLGPDTGTPTGRFNIQSKYPSKHMGDGSLASDIEAYELVGVPWNCFFTAEGHAFHGTYWHDNFGVPMSHGCVNMRPEDAKFLFRWGLPIIEMKDIDANLPDKIGFGTPIRIF